MMSLQVESDMLKLFSYGESGIEVSFLANSPVITLSNMSSYSYQVEGELNNHHIRRSSIAVL